MTLRKNIVLGLPAMMLSVLIVSSLKAQNSSDRALFVIPEAKGHRLVLVDPRLKTVVGSISVPGWPHEIAFSQDGRTGYVPSYSDAIVGAPGLDGQTIDVVNMQTRSFIKTWDLGKPLRPHKLMVTKDGDLLVSTELAHSISIVDTATGKIRDQIPTGAAESHVFVVTTDGKKIYTANLHAGSVSVLDRPSGKLLKVIRVSDLIQRIALSKDDKWLFVTDGKSHNVVVIDTSTDEVRRSVPVGGIPFSVQVSPDGLWLLVGEDSDSKGKLEVVNLKDMTITHSFEVDRLPYGIQIFGSEAFVACLLSGNLDVLNMSTWTLEAPITNVAHGDGITLWRSKD
jgi:YVTN family beta-propeller protein